MFYSLFKTPLKGHHFCKATLIPLFWSESISLSPSFYSPWTVLSFLDFQCVSLIGLNSMSCSSQGPSIGSECLINAQWIVQGQEELSPFIKLWGILELSPEEWGLSEPFPEDAGWWACGSRKAYFCLRFQAFIIAPASCLMSTQSDFLLLVIHQNCSNIWKGPEIDSLILQLACLSWWLVEGWADCFSFNNYLGASDNIRGNKQLERLETGNGGKKAGRGYGKNWESSCTWG